MRQAIEFYWKLKAVDSLEITDIPAERYDEIVQHIIGYGDMAKFITKSIKQEEYAAAVM